MNQETLVNMNERKVAHMNQEALSTINKGKVAHMDRQILVGVDELTLVLSVDKNKIKHVNEWEDIAEKIIEEFERLANLESIFGKQMDLESTPPKGYINAYQYGYNPFYFAVAYHPSHPKMGVIAKFSAHSWSVYCEKGRMNIKRFLDSVQSDTYRCRLSRVDFAIDYQNWDISVNGIYQNIIDNRLEIHTYQGKINHSTTTALERDGIASTFYIGSKKSGTKLFLRVYDKRAEQVAQSGFRLGEALSTSSWVRFEAVFKGDYAHQLTDIIRNKNEGQLTSLIINKVTEKYRFYDVETEEYTDFSKALLEMSKEDFESLRTESTRDNELVRSLVYLVDSSGLFPILYKCDDIWGDETSMDFLEILHDIYLDEFEPNDDVMFWLKNHKGTLEKQSFESQTDMMHRLRKSRIKDDE